MKFSSDCRRSEAINMLDNTRLVPGILVLKGANAHVNWRKEYKAGTCGDLPLAEVVSSPNLPTQAIRLTDHWRLEILQRNRGASIRQAFDRKIRTMNRVTAILGCISVFSAFLLGPFMHMHESVGHDHTAGEERPATVHSHISFDAPELVDYRLPILRHPRSGTTRQLSVFNFQKVSPAPQPRLITVTLWAPVLIVCEFLADVPDQVAHAPPRVDCSGPRPPPA